MTNAREFIKNYGAVMQSKEGWRFCSFSCDKDFHLLSPNNSELVFKHGFSEEFAFGSGETEKRIIAKIWRNLKLPNLLDIEDPNSKSLDCVVGELSAEYRLKHRIFGCIVGSTSDLNKVNDVKYDGYLINWVPPINLGDDFSKVLEKLLFLAEINPINYSWLTKDFIGLYDCFHQKCGLVQGVLDVTDVQKKDGITFLTFSGAAGVRKIRLPYFEDKIQSSSNILYNPEQLVGTKVFVQIDYIPGRLSCFNHCTFASIPKSLYVQKDES
jgi:hypothetical protein